MKGNAMVSSSVKPATTEHSLEPPAYEVKAVGRISLPIRVRSSLAGRVLFTSVVLLSLADFVLQTIDHRMAISIPGWVQLVKLFDLDREFSIPTWFSILMMALSAIFFGVIAMAERRRGATIWKYWAGIAVVFVGLSMDEQILAHESLGGLISEHFETGSIFFYAWVIPGILFVFLLGAVFVPFLLRLEARTRNGLVVAGTLFLSGALGMEMASGIAADEDGIENLRYATLTSIEETLELFGLAYLLVVLITEIRHRLKRFSVVFE